MQFVAAQLSNYHIVAIQKHTPHSAETAAAATATATVAPAFQLSKILSVAIRYACDNNWHLFCPL